MATNAIALPEGFELDEPAVAKPSGPPAGFVLDAPKAPEQPKGLPPGFVLDSPVSKGNKTAAPSKDIEQNVTDFFASTPGLRWLAKPTPDLSAQRLIDTITSKMGYAPPTPQADLMGALQTGTRWLNEQVTPQNAVLIPLAGEMLATKAVSPVINVVKAGLAAYFAKKQAEQAGTSFGKSFELHQERQAFDEANRQSRSNELQLKQPVEPPAYLSDASIQEATVRSFLDTIMGAVMGAGAHGMAARTAMEGRPTGVKPEATPTPSTRELVLANAREGLPNNPQEIQRKII